MGTIGFGAWIVFAAAKASSVAVGSLSLFAEMRGGNAEY
jgi:hypothetical protein